MNRRSEYHPERLGLIPEHEMSSTALSEAILSFACIVFVFAVIIAAFFVVLSRPV